MRALVTGSAGFVGRHMTAELRTRGYDVVERDIRYGSYGGYCRADGDNALNTFLGDIRRFDLVVHAAAQSPHRAAIDGQPATLIYNQLLDAAMFEWAIRTGQGRVLYLSSCAALDEQPDDYGQLKLAGERMAAQARRAGLPVTVVRPYSGYGEDQGPDWPFGAFIARARRGDDPFEIWGDGQQVRDWIHISDVVAGALAVADSGTEDPVSLCTGLGTSMLEMASLICAAAGYSASGPPDFKLLGGPHAGADRRVGDPSVLHRYYTPKVSVWEGIRRALGVASNA